MPVVFVSHGAPDTLLKSPAVVCCWADIGQAIPAPRAILAVSAHWETRVPTASLSGAPATIHDFSGFAPELHRMHYPAPGAPALAERAAQLLGADLHPNRGLDHGAWVPLKAMFPQADIPVTQLSVTRQTPADHFALGQALAPLCDEGVLILTSGAITHNFGWIDWQATEDTPPFPPAQAFADWVAQRLAENDTAALFDYRNAPNGAAAHPTEEHLLPFFVAMGAGGSTPVRHRPPFSYGALAMDAYVWH
jgi:4,5-DOPA dioxygenase extradiol